MVANYVATVTDSRQFLRRTGHEDVPYVSLVAPSAPILQPITITTASGATVQWTETADPGVVRHTVYVDGLKYGDFGAAALSAQITGLAAATTHTVQVTRWNGVLESNRSNSQSFTTGTAGTVPPAPTLAAISNINTGGGTASWTEGVGAGTLTGHRLYIDGVASVQTISGAATSAAFSGLAAGTSHSVQVASVNATGEGPRSNTRTFTTSQPSAGSNVFMGISISNGTEAHTWKAIRLYRLGNLSDGTVEQYLGNAAASGIVAYTDDTRCTSTSPQATCVSAMQSALTQFYSGSARDNLELHISISNETDRENGEVPPSGFANKYEALSQLIYATTGGVRDWPKASLWINLTTSNVQAGVSPPWLDQRTTTGSNLRVADIVNGPNGGVSCSLYPALRNNDRIYEPYANYIDPPLDLCASRGIQRFSCWEYGQSVDPDITRRPATVEGHAHYGMQGAIDRGIDVRCWLYFNQDGTATTGRFSHDTGLTTPDSRTTWFRAASTFQAA